MTSGNVTGEMVLRFAVPGGVKKTREYRIT
jgi:hypothetical protein